jgi:hypothetical protein
MPRLFATLTTAAGDLEFSVIGVVAIGSPHDGQLTALLDIWLLHSGHLIRAIKNVLRQLTYLSGSAQVSAQQAELLFSETWRDANLFGERSTCSV